MAQIDRATLVGTTDTTRVVTPGATVEMVSQETGLRRQVQTNEAGAYTVSSLPIGNYSVTVSLPGFATATIQNVRLGVGDTRTLDVQLHLRAQEIQVNVEATPLETNTV